MNDLKLFKINQWESTNEAEKSFWRLLKIFHLNCARDYSAKESWTFASDIVYEECKCPMVEVAELTSALQGCVTVIYYNHDGQEVYGGVTWPKNSAYPVAQIF